MASRTELEPLSPDDHAVPGQWQSQSLRDNTARRLETKTTWYPRVRETFRRRDGSQKGWKPLSMTAPILTLLTILTLLIGCAIEALAQLSRSRGGLALSRTQDEIPQYAMISYLYAPNIIAVLYSLVWSWVDLDVKRMQPWFELSKLEGATAENSMFLDYPYDFIATVPIKAARRRHWPVFFAGTVTVVIFWLITPLQSSIMGTGLVNITAPAIIGTRSSIVPLATQSDYLTNQILNTGYSIAWLSQSWPPFTTADYGTLPFYIDNDPGESQLQTNWTATTTKLWTELECWPAEQPVQNFSTMVMHFGNGQGCNTTINLDVFAYLKMYYVGYYTSPFSDYQLADTENCPATANATHQFLAVWVSTKGGSAQKMPEVDITALFCEPSYYKQQVMVTVDTNGFQPLNSSIQPISPPEHLTEKEFNSTSFEFLIANGMPMEQVLDITRDFPFEYVIEQSPRLDKTNLSIPVSNMVGYALAPRNVPATPYGDPVLLHEAFNRAHKYLFSIAVNQMLVNDTTVVNSTAVSEFQQSGIIVSRLFSAIVEGLLLFVAISTTCLLWFCHASTSYLTNNPSSISRLAAIFRHGQETNKSFRPADHADEKSLKELFKDDKFRLTRGEYNSDGNIYLEKVDGPEGDENERKFDKPIGYYDPIRPTPLKREIGLLFGLVQVGALATIVYLKVQNDKNKGLIRPSNSFEVLQILENYIPTAFATFSEPFWVLINRFMCLLQPFKVLSRGRSEPSKSIDTTYTALPPQLVIWRALRSRHFMLAMLCIIALLSNVLAVGLGALFNEDQTTAIYTSTFTPNIAPQFDNQTVFDLHLYFSLRTIATGLYQDEAYIAMANYTSGTQLPPWTTSDYFFQPYTVDSGGQSNSSSTYRIPTRGFGASMNCTAVPQHTLALSYPASLASACSADATTQLEVAEMVFRTNQTTRPAGQSAIEYSDSLQSKDSFDDCSRPMTFGWGRTPQALNMNATVEASFAICHIFFQTAMFDVRHDAEGNVLEYERTSDLSTHLDGDDGDVQTNRMIINMNNLVRAYGRVWHNDTLSRDWINYLLTTTLDARDFLDPSKPVPDPNDLIPAIEKVYRQLFAILLSLNQQLFVPGDEEASITGQRLTEETRIFMDQNAFIIAVTVLSLNIVAVVIFYSRGIIFNLPRVPTTIGSVLAFVSASHILEDQGPSSRGQDGKSREKKTYSFGRYIGVDQKVHLGIDMDPYVALVDPASLKEKKTLLQRVVTGDLRRRNQGTFEPVRNGTWL
ncbi:uncharacterized protein Triagg1_1726 [Trichoderma aggressivum f. europaeum]|uniref:Uncharacterized protein n=1 Tax=Trichoderma aggressivum f. europaeum TaxID=173218 RepID=A0AAE1IJP7_9HYPO|nr:hypothetical protein Triagg1_1726 [Trichoderma aggressivum f. europaeum]